MDAALISGQTPFFRKDATFIVKGVAIIMMFSLHFFANPSWWIEGINYPFLEKYYYIFRSSLNLCVPIFCFLTGYFYFFNPNKTYSYSVKKITDILIYYWGVFFLYALVAVVAVKYVYDPASIIKEMFALVCPTMTFNWYVYFYILLMLMLPLLCRILSKNVYFDLLFSVVFLPITIGVVRHVLAIVFYSEISQELLGSLMYLPAVLVGYIFGRYRIFERISRSISRIIINSNLSIYIWIFGIFAFPLCRYFLPSLSFNFCLMPFINNEISPSLLLDFVYAPLYIYCLVNLSSAVRSSQFKHILSLVGKRSLLMWFVSYIFFNNSKTVFQPLLYLPKNPIFVLIWGMVLCYLFAAILDVGLSALIRVKNKY